MTRKRKNNNRWSSGSTPQKENKRQTKMSSFVTVDGTCSGSECIVSDEHSQATNSVDDGAHDRSEDVVSHVATTATESHPDEETHCIETDVCAKKGSSIKETTLSTERQSQFFEDDPFDCYTHCPSENDNAMQTCDSDLMGEINKKLSCLTIMSNDMRILKDSVQEVVSAIKFCAKKLEEAEVRIKDLTLENNSLDERVDILTHQNTLLNRKLSMLEDYSRKENFILSGVKETQNENCFNVVRELLECIGGENIIIQRCHRLGKQFPGKQRDIIVRLLHYQDLVMVLHRRMKLPQGIYINEDVCAATRRKINTLRPVYKEAKKIDRSAKMMKDRIIFKGKEYTVQNIHAINLNTKTISEKTDQVTIAFASRFTPFSNLYPYQIEIDGKLYPSTEHYYQYKKCQSAGAKLAAAEVMLAQEPEDAMFAGAKVKPNMQWYQTDGKQIMKKAVQVKFSSPSMQQKLRSTGKCVLVEATRNTIWGTGVPFTNDQALNPRAFKGQNLLGTILMELRDKQPIISPVKTNPSSDYSHRDIEPTGNISPRTQTPAKVQSSSQPDSDHTRIISQPGSAQSSAHHGDTHSSNQPAPTHSSNQPGPDNSSIQLLTKTVPMSDVAQSTSDSQATS